ncbi:Glycosyl hydrolase family 49 [Planctomycetes bacterium CA13]|uniref:Glycosyl hydrolase family 49 n=1 Tax=Novipirellula herctigrandis TaxID=2527986 RepID=A0A5C5ZAU9_9BACT|nr:Glycosyl hydrolase family 49 [Planctomycetes bacterium CA13]
MRILFERPCNYLIIVTAMCSAIVVMGSVASGRRVSIPTQSVDQLRQHFSGKITQQDETVTFTQSGVIAFDDSNRSFIWNVPPSIKRIVVRRNVMVNGALHLRGDCTIEGLDRERSGFFGTNQQAWPQNHGIKAFQVCTIQGYGEGTITIKNLTFKNPRGFFIRGGHCPVHVSNCDFLETRPAYHNHSDGFEGGPGSTVDECHFDAGDDIIKVYNDVTVTNTTIVVGINAVPIQFGWGDYGSGAQGVFRNVKIDGNVGRGPLNASIVARAGKYDKTILLDHCSIDTPNGSLFHAHDDASNSHINVTIKNSNVRVKAFGLIACEMNIRINGTEYETDSQQTLWEAPEANAIGCSRQLPVMVRDAQPTDPPILRW